MNEEFQITRPLDGLPNAAGRAKILTTAVAIGGRSVLRGAAGQAVRGASELAVGQGLARGMLRGGGKVAARAAPILAVIEFGIDQVQTANAHARGEIDGEAFARETAGNVGNAAGGLGGAAAGAALGSIILPGLGTLVGAILGGIAGGRGGRAIGRALVE